MKKEAVLQIVTRVTLGSTFECTCVCMPVITLTLNVQFCRIHYTVFQYKLYSFVVSTKPFYSVPLKLCSVCLLALQKFIVSPFFIIKFVIFAFSLQNFMYHHFNNTEVCSLQILALQNLKCPLFQTTKICSVPFSLQNFVVFAFWHYKNS